MIELRCQGTLFGILSDDHQTVEVKCKRRICGASNGVVVLHTIQLSTGRVIKTRRFSQPTLEKGH